MSPKINRTRELKWNQIARPDVKSKAATAPVSGQGLGFTMWYACAWWAIRRSLGGRGLEEVRIHRPELLLRPLLEVLIRVGQCLLKLLLLVLGGVGRRQLWRLVELASVPL